MANTTNKSSPTGAQTPTESTQQTPTGWQDFATSDNDPYGGVANTPESFDGYNRELNSGEAAAQQGKLSQHGG